MMTNLQTQALSDRLMGVEAKHALEVLQSHSLGADRNGGRVSLRNGGPAA
jgi:hypothetical protein